MRTAALPHRLEAARPAPQPLRGAHVGPSVCPTLLSAFGLPAPV